MSLLKPPGVYAPQHDTYLLGEALLAEDVTGALVLDVGAGTGALALTAARRGAARVVAVDLSRRAVWATRLNALAAGLPVRACRGDLLAPVRGHRFDLVLANPPYVPAPAAGAPRGAARAWDAGRDGRAVLDRLCAGVPSMLLPGGVVLVVHSELGDPDRTVRLLAAAGLRAGVSRRRAVPFGPVVRERAAWLRSRGLIRPGQDSEELVVIRAERDA
ncbi:methyltransferase [Streptomyces sp. SL13]|uniref:Methyltransferase n=1 Tax=Streptantibioticus silvisoli TaxID=2705255 RepID=A0AA90H2G2_9ACTN|nr:HemK2/MTQ2 family protein methyltransferase [Streptantibioticus silvisoli]MDI5964386.1 methyltransferase [Streptantibioticus silvisoli]MDI5969032.1 methyltransferase [Streptantibioticus silvisoli]